MASLEVIFHQPTMLSEMLFVLRQYRDRSTVLYVQRHYNNLGFLEPFPMKEHTLYCMLLCSRGERSKVGWLNKPVLNNELTHCKSRGKPK